MSASLNSSVIDELRELMADDFSHLLSTFLQDGEEHVSTLKRLHEQGDAVEFARSAHSFKGSCSNIGAEVLAEHCKQAEMLGKANQLSAATLALQAIEAEFARVREALSALV